MKKIKLLICSLFASLIMFSCNTLTDEQQVIQVATQHIDYAIDHNFEGFKTLLHPDTSEENLQALSDEFQTDGFKEIMIYFDRYRVGRVEIEDENTAIVEIELFDDDVYTVNLSKVKNKWYIYF